MIFVTVSLHFGTPGIGGWNMDGERFGRMLNGRNGMMTDMAG
jgi:hypothetical protein